MTEKSYLTKAYRHNRQACFHITECCLQLEFEDGREILEGYLDFILLSDDKNGDVVCLQALSEIA